MPKIGISLRNLRDRIRASVNVKADNILFFMALSLVVIVAIMIRLTPIIRGPLLIKAFDPWIQYYNAKYISEHSLYEYFTWHDEKSWYPEGKDRATLRPGLPFTAVIIFYILRFLGIPITIYEVCYFFPAFMGGLTVLAAYFLGKEVYNRSCGLFTAFFLAFNTGHMQRTMAGFFDNETIGVFATLMTLLFFLKAIRTGRFSYSIIGGMFLGYLSLSWGGYQFVFYILPIMVIIIVLMDKYNENILIAYAGVQGTGLSIFSLYFSFQHDNFFSDLSLGGIFLFTIVLIVFHLIYINKKEYPKLYYKLLNSVKWGVIPISLTLAIIIWLKPEWIQLEQFGLGGRLSSVLSPLIREDMHLVASVAEHMPSAWAVFYYNTLIPLILLPLGIFFCFKRLKAPDILMITFLLTLFYFTGSMIRIILLFAPAASLMGAYGLVNILKIFGSFVGEKRITPIRRRRRQLKRSVGNSEVFTVYFLVGFLCLAQVLHATDISINQLSYSQMVVGGEYHDWEETLVWMKNNIDGTDVVVSWWDYGYWLTPVGNVTTVNDNNTHDGQRIGLVGMAFMQTNEIYSAKILRELEADYILVYFGFLLPGFGGDEGKWPWMLRICNDHYEFYKDEGYEEDNWADDSVFIEDDYINETSGLYKEAWFNSQLVRLMFYSEPTSPSGVNPNEDYLRWYYASQIGGNPSQGISPREDDEGNEWKDYIPKDGAYDFKIFKEAYFSQHGIVKLYKVDYTALDSSFSIEDAKVFDMDAATFNLRNTGLKDLTITNVAINKIEHNFTIGSTTNILKQGEQVPVWVDIENKDFRLNDVVNISVTASSTALDGKPYAFDESTKDFFVTKAEPGDIQINKENSKVVYTGSQNDVYLEVENIGNKIENLNDFYFDAKNNVLNPNNTKYLSGSSVLNPGTKCLVRLSNVPADFYIPDSVKGHLIGVKTSSGETDEILFSVNTEGYELSILNQDRRLSPEALAAGVGTYKTHIPLDFDDSGTYVYYNGSMRIRVKNTGSGVLGLASVYIGEADSVRYGNIYNLTASNFISIAKWDTLDRSLTLQSGEENTILVDASDFDLDVNEEIVIAVTAISGEDLSATAASDIGLINVLNNTQDLHTIDEIENHATSYIMANETGALLLKNTGNKPLELGDITLNITTLISIDNDATFLYGDKFLDVQECALISFDIPDLKINKSDSIIVNITTNTTVGVLKTYKALENLPQNPNYYDIEIDMQGADASQAINNGDLTLKIDNEGRTPVTIDSVSINNTYVDINNFSEPPYIISLGGSIEITLTNFEIYVPLTIISGSKINIWVYTNEGAEDAEIIIVT